MSRGYCSRFCDDNADCPLTHHCDLASAGGTKVKVCFAGAQPVFDAATDCGTDEQCPAGEHCTTAGACSFECRTDDDCGGTMACDDRGRCATGDGGGGCCDANRDPAGALTALALGLACALVPRRSRRPRRRAR